RHRGPARRVAAVGPGVLARRRHRLPDPARRQPGGGGGPRPDGARGHHLRPPGPARRARDLPRGALPLRGQPERGPPAQGARAARHRARRAEGVGGGDRPRHRAGAGDHRGRPLAHRRGRGRPPLSRRVRRLALAAAGLLAAAACAPASAQSPWSRALAPFPVLVESGTPYDPPFFGGLDVPRPQLVDIDGDGDLDLFLQERTDQLTLFENTGSAAVPRFEWRTDRYQGLETGEWYRFTDLDGDGLPDLLGEAKYSRIRYWRNAGGGRFTVAADTLLDVDGVAIFAERQNIANLTDLDCNGRPDLFLGQLDGSVDRYEQVGTDAAGAPSFLLLARRFENISIVAQMTPTARHG